MKRILLLGTSSGIGESFAKNLSNKDVEIVAAAAWNLKKWINESSFWSLFARLIMKPT